MPAGTRAVIFYSGDKKRPKLPEKLELRPHCGYPPILAKTTRALGYCDVAKMILTAGEA